MRSSITLAAALGLSWMLAACGGGGDASVQAQAETQADLVSRPATTRSDTGPGDADRYWPAEVGDTWLYDVRMTGDEGEALAWSNVVTVMSSEPDAGATRVSVKEASHGQEGLGSLHTYFIDRGGVTYLPSVTPDAASNALLAQQGPYRSMLFPLKEGQRFLAFDDKGLAFQADVDGDGKPEAMDLRMTVTFVGFEPVSVPVGVFAVAAKYERRVVHRLTLSKGGAQREQTTVATAWYVSGVGLVRMTVDTVDDGQLVHGPLHALKAYTVGGVSVGTFAFLQMPSSSSGFIDSHAYAANLSMLTQTTHPVGWTEPTDDASGQPSEPAPETDPNRL